MKDMKSVVRVVKRGRREAVKALQPQDNNEKKAPSEREIANTIKSWIADRQQRKRLTEVTNWELLTKFAQ
jgi:hypothetical protein